MNSHEQGTTPDAAAGATQRSAEPVQTQAPPPVTTKKSDGKDPVKTITYGVLGLVVLLFVWYVLADRHTPWTDQARVVGFVVPITPKVSGKIETVNVVQHQLVEAGDLLAQIDPREYQLAVQRAESNLEIAGQDTGADTAAVRAAEAAVTESQAQLAKARQDLERLERIKSEDPGAVRGAAMDMAVSTVAVKEARQANAIADLEGAKERLGKGGEDNPKVRDAVATLEQARIDLADTSLYAPSAGGITNLQIDEGQYAQVGVPLMTFVSFTDVWITAYLRENSIQNLKAGDQVEIALDAAPGTISPGVVNSVGFGVSQPSGGAVGELETVKTDSGWLRGAQRFPVIIHFADDSARGTRRMGGQADVQIYSEGHPILNTMGRIWIRFMSFMSYVY